MSKILRVTGATLAAASLSLLLAGAGLAQTPGPRSKSEPASVSAAAVMSYWTDARMRSALPMPLGQYSPASSSAAATSGSLPLGTPGAAPGWSPDSGAPAPGTTATLTFGPTDQTQTAPPFSAPSTPTDFGNYAPFQRFTWPGNLRLYPVSTIGKLFFTQNSQNFVCSASVIGRSTLATAGHCVHAGNNLGSGWSSNLLFCPSYSPAGQDSVRGCWVGVSETTSAQWFSSSNSDRDYGCIVTRNTGQKLAQKIGDVTGWTGRAWNWASRTPILAWGYPQAAPFAGNRLITTASTEWYELNRNTSESQLSKYIGSDQTGGSSGGPWWLNFTGGVEIAPVDSAGITDPNQSSSTNAAPWINGINSHKRCSQSGCPDVSIFKDEMGSPQFRSSSSDNNDSEDVFAVCLANANNNPS